MDLRDTSEQARFRAKLRGWLRDNVPQQEPAEVAARFWWRHDWHKRLYAQGWIGLGLPPEYGGRGLDLADQLIVFEEFTAAEAPPVANWVGLELVAPTLLRWATDAQKSRHVTGIVNGSEIWCQAFSEEHAGSDLAAVRTTATAKDDGFVLEGHKRWTSWAHFADHALVLARTGATADRHRAVSCFIVPLNAPGVTVTPVDMLYGDAEENDVRFDQVRLDSDALVGELHLGWPVLMTSLSLARGMSTLTRVAALKVMFAGLCRERLRAHGGTTTGLPADEAAVLTDHYARIEALRFLAYRKLGEMAETGVPGPIASTEKLLWGELSRDVAGYALELSGVDGVGHSPGEVCTGWPRELFRGLGNAIEGGTSEIQRSTIAKHVLGLPS